MSHSPPGSLADRVSPPARELAAVYHPAIAFTEPTDPRAVINAIFYRLRTGCQRRLPPRCFPPWGTVHRYVRAWDRAGVWTRLHRAAYALARAAAGHCPTVGIMDGPSVKTTERGGACGFAAHKVVKGRKRHILLDTPGLLVAARVKPAGMSDRRAGERLVHGLAPLGPRTRTIMADARRESRRLARLLRSHAGWDLQIVGRRERAFKITGLTWIVDRTFAWLGRDSEQAACRGPDPGASETPPPPPAAS